MKAFSGRSDLLGNMLLRSLVVWDLVLRCLRFLFFSFCSCVSFPGTAPGFREIDWEYCFGGCYIFYDALLFTYEILSLKTFNFINKTIGKLFNPFNLRINKPFLNSRP